MAQAMIPAGSGSFAADAFTAQQIGEVQRSLLRRTFREIGTQPDAGARSGGEPVSSVPI